MKFRLIDTGSNNGFFNMAVDEAIMHFVRQEMARPAIRFYQWRPSCLSIGYFQGLSEINIDNCKKWGVDIVRRLTGGKAVFHNEELTYSIIAPEGFFPGSIIESYKIISTPISETLRQIGLNATLSRPGTSTDRVQGAGYRVQDSEHTDTDTDTDTDTENRVQGAVVRVQETRLVPSCPLPPDNRTLSSAGTSPCHDKKTSSPICFHESSYYEINVNNKKIVGSAQARIGGVLLQHGSILLDLDAKSLCALFNIQDNSQEVERTLERVTSLNQESGRAIGLMEIKSLLIKNFEDALNIELVKEELTDEELWFAKEKEGEYRDVS